MTGNITNHERPGVYSVYDASAVIDGSGGGKVVGLCAHCTTGMVGQLYEIDRYDQAVTAFGATQEITELIRLLLLNGARRVLAVTVESDNGYAGGFATLDAREEVGVVVCDSTTLSVQRSLRESVETASEARRERIAVLCGGANETVSSLAVRANELNSRRVVLVVPGAVVGAGQSVTGGRVAAAVAGAIAGESDPAVPLGGAILKGLPGLALQYSDNEIDTLVRGGITPVETVGGQISVVRGITTKSNTGGAADSTWRELTTILIVDEVIPGIRNALRTRFQRVKNTEQGRGAIRAQVILELESRMEREIITGYDGVAVSAVEGKPTVCLVEFSFTVAHGLNQIWLSAHITV